MNKSTSNLIAVIIVFFMLAMGAFALTDSVKEWIGDEPATTTEAPTTSKAPTTSTTPMVTTTVPTVTTTVPTVTTTTPTPSPTPVCVHSYTSEVTKTPTCSDGIGVKTYTCEKCGHSYTEEFTQEVRHSEGNYTFTKEATCETAGTKESYCVNCGHHMRTLEIPALGHDYASEVTKTPTCSDMTGERTYTCVNCARSYVEEFRQEVRHMEGNYTFTKEATCETAGTKESYCVNCGYHMRTLEIPALNHFYSDGESAVSLNYYLLNSEDHVRHYDCAICGETLYSGSAPHVFKGDDICDDCGYECTHDYDVNTGYCNVCDCPCDHVWGEGNYCIYCGYFGG